MLYFNKNSVLQFTDWGGEWYLLLNDQNLPGRSVIFFFNDGTLKTLRDIDTVRACTSLSTLHRERSHLSIQFISKEENASFLGLSQAG